MALPIGLAFVSGCLYYLGFVFFKDAAAVLPPLRATRPGAFAGSVVRNGRWLVGAALMGAGVVIQVVAAPRLPIPVLVTALLTGLAALVVLSLAVTGERPGGAEAAWLTAMAAGGLLVSWSSPAVPAEVPGVSLALLAVVSLGLPVLLFTVGDARPDGRHARPLTGIAYGVGAGVLVGFAELAFNLQARAGWGVDAFTGPLVPLFLVGVTLGLAQLQMALQRCRLLTVVFVATVVAKAFLVVGCGLLALPAPGPAFTTPWLLAAGLPLIVLSLVLIPTHEPTGPAHEPTRPSR
ncbi:hypothetical protein [Actinocorallia sp. A-T 12471]|uniref:hypothetical protein n=1 Tax=Actinocorallia sp. A-T 12471 TaxID=3089813 RepID=UPI0029CFF213|nr:hypothetical protein [Actinocorallia sp. A-T 12471]MDX6744200.1 hypothetical protein [Actinocorallia sp. A-T 12471]